ncbi:hypothetical protein [Bartonella sp. AA131HXZ]|uniref:hypothetical protein n=1 Tax=Bartonella sp. AA131HXZ TaxID=1460967 RepID=UPI0035D01319
MGKVGWRGSLAVIWGELGGAWWAQNGLIDFYSAWAPFSQKNCFIGLDCWEKQGGEGEFCRYVGWRALGKCWSSNDGRALRE